MNTTFWDRLDLVARAILPVFVSLFLAVITVLPLARTGASLIAPTLPLVAVYYWSVHRPQLMPIWAVCIIGLAQDFLGGGPLGVHAIALLSMSALISWQRRIFASASFVMVWFVFALLAAVAITLEWLLICLAYSAYVEPRPALFQHLLAVALYPCFAWLAVQGGRLLRT